MMAALTMKTCCMLCSQAKWWGALLLSSALPSEHLVSMHCRAQARILGAMSWWEAGV